MSDEKTPAEVLSELMNVPFPNTAYLDSMKRVFDMQKRMLDNFQSNLDQWFERRREGTEATLKMLSELKDRLGLADERMPMALRNVGNTVSSTLPILIDQLRQEKRIVPGIRSMLIGFGVGWSWAGCMWRESLPSR